MAAGPGYQPSPAYAGPGAAPTGKHYFEGLIDYQGLLDKPPGLPWSMHCRVRHEDLLCDAAVAGLPFPIVIGFRGSSSTVCTKLGTSPRWVPLGNLASMYSKVPRKKVERLQSKFRWTGRWDSILGHRCREAEYPSDDGLVRGCYSPDVFFEGNHKLLPAMRQAGFDSGFVSEMRDVGIGWKVQEWDKDGTPIMSGQATRIQPGPVSPAVFAGVCDMP